MGLATLVLREAPETPYRAPPDPVNGTRPEGSHPALMQTNASEVPSDPAPVRTSDSEARSGDPAHPDRLEALGDEIALLAAHVHAATHRMLVLVAEFDALGGWEPAGHRSCAHWLAYRTGLDLNAAREKVRAARALRDLPGTSAAMSRGELSFSQVRALTRVANPENEEDLLDLATGCTTAQLERLVRAWKKGSRQDEAEREKERYRSRTFAVFPDDDGMYAVQGRLMPEVGALLMRAIEAANDALFREERAPGMPRTGRQAAQRRADAMALLAERALAAGFGGRASGDAEGAAPEPTGGGVPDPELRPPCSCDGAPLKAPISGTRAQRYQVLLHVEAETLAAEGEPGRSEMEDGTRVSAETSRRLSCDAGVVRVTHGADGSILNVGRKTRTISPALRRALEVRDRGCRFPGCGVRFTDAHHVTHWADGGETSLENCVLLCFHHHRLVHEEGWHIQWWGSGRPAFVDPRGQVHFEGRWTPPELPTEPVDALVMTHRLLGVSPDAGTAGARWKTEDAIPDAVYFQALEALQTGGA